MHSGEVGRRQENSPGEAAAETRGTDEGEDEEIGSDDDDTGCGGEDSGSIEASKVCGVDSDDSTEGGKEVTQCPSWLAVVWVVMTGRVEDRR